MSFQLAPPLPGLYPQRIGDLPPSLPASGQQDASLAGRWLSAVQNAKPYIPEENPWALADKTASYSPNDTLRMWMQALGYEPGQGRLRMPETGGTPGAASPAQSVPPPAGPGGLPPDYPDQERDQQRGELPAREPEGAWSEVPYRIATATTAPVAGSPAAFTGGGPYGGLGPGGPHPVGPGGSYSDTVPVGGIPASPAPGADLSGWSADYYPQGANEAAVESPAGAVAYMLKERGIHPESPLGKLYLDKAPELLVAYKLYAGQSGQPANDKTLFMSFVKGYLDMAFSQDPAARDQLAKLRGVLKAQVKIGLEDPNTQLGAAMRDLADPRMGGSPERLWQAVFQPALEATAAPNLYQQAKKGQYYRLYRAWTEHQVRAAVNNQQSNVTFPDFLAQAGFEV